MLLRTDASLDDHIDSYWLFERDARGIAPVYEFPSLAPELVLCVRGRIRFVYDGVPYALHRSTIFGHLNARMLLHLDAIDHMVVVRFKSRGVASVLPFTGMDALRLTRHPFLPATALFGDLRGLEQHLVGQPPEDLATTLDDWFLRRLDPGRCGMVTELGPTLDAVASVEELATLTASSYSTVERSFRRETGLTPKRFLMRNRFRRVLADLFTTRSTDWMDFVFRYGYHDQSHFIKEVKRYSGFTPHQLLNLPLLADHRPRGAFDG